ncbi:Melanoma inhibitory activity protein 2, partial [Varanus komodoensis]
MVEILDIRILLLTFSFITNIKSTKMLSDQKKCGDPECESTDFGFFSMDAVQIEEVFIKNEVEVPTKETDFVCLDGEEFVFENDDSILNYHDEEKENMPPYGDEKESKVNIPEDEVQIPTGITFPKEYTESPLDNYEVYSKSNGLNTMKTISDGDSEIRESKAGQGERTDQEDQISQTLTPAPTKSTWTVTGFAGWFGMKSEENEEVVKEISQTTEEITFRRRKIAIIVDSDFKKLNEEDEVETQTSGWFQSTLTDMLHFGNAKSGVGLSHNEHYPEIHESSTSATSADHQSSQIVSERRKEGESDSEQSKSNWFDLELSNILTFGYAEESEIKEVF